MIMRHSWGQKCKDMGAWLHPRYEGKIETGRYQGLYIGNYTDLFTISSKAKITNCFKALKDHSIPSGTKPFLIDRVGCLQDMASNLVKEGPAHVKLSSTMSSKDYFNSNKPDHNRTNKSLFMVNRNFTAPFTFHSLFHLELIWPKA